MRPPSYYAAPAARPKPERPSSQQQLRAGLAGPSAAAYVARRHLPFAAQSVLVAHCITAAGSSTRPYAAYSRPAALSAYKYTPSYAPSYTSAAALSHRPAYASRAPSSPRSYAPAAYTATYSSAYQPARLRDRPLLSSLAGRRPEPAGRDWAADAGRTISRNKYLIKFRERRRSPRPAPARLLVEPAAGQLSLAEWRPPPPLLALARPEPRPAPEPEPPKRQPRFKPRLKAVRDRPQLQPKPLAQPPAQADLEPQPEPQLAPQAEPKPEPKAETKPEPKPEPEPEPEQPEPKLQVRTEAKPARRRIRFRDYQLADFELLSVLGHGGWGFVVLAELRGHDACFAVKCIKKITIVEDDDFESIMIERKVLTLGNLHPLICKLFCTFQTEGYLFFAMEFCPGGDLMFHVQREGKFAEPRCRFYAAEIICAIRFLHNQHIIYRDLKLDNILLDARGHIRLVDFGMCQCRSYREEMLPSNFCGTPEYISPEIIKGVPYNHSVDWWSFGVLLYEMAVGKMPFRGGDENELLWNVCYETIHYPVFLSRELSALLQQLLEREPEKRMGMASCKAGDICQQPWFAGLDWAAAGELRLAPPFEPALESPVDVQNFDADFTAAAPELEPVEPATLARIEQSLFHKFPYTNPNTFIFDAPNGS